jgi:tetratricopeptide (TPR) repeat protein
MQIGRTTESRACRAAGLFVLSGLAATLAPATGAAQESPVDAVETGTAPDEGAGDEGFVFEAGDVGSVTAGTPVARYMDEGLRYYGREDYAPASVFFWRVVQEQDVSADALRPRAQYELARTLTRMQMWQGALRFFDDIIATGPTHPYFEASAPWVVLIARRVPGDAQMLRRVAAFADLFPDRVEPKYRDEMAFMLGEQAFNSGELEQALRYFGAVSDASTYHARALYYAGITHVRLYDAQPAVDAFKTLLSARQNAASGDELERLDDLAMLSIARTFYSTGEFEKSLRYFGQIPQDSSTWLDALFESSWAYFRVSDFNRALGNLHSLNSPYFSSQYYPEAPVLQAVILFRNCRYTGVRRTLDRFDDVYMPLLRQLEQTTSSLQGDREYATFYKDAERRLAADFDPRLAQITSAALSDRSVRLASEYASRVEDEAGLIEGADPAWAGSDLAVFLRDVVADEREQADGQLGRQVRVRIERILEDLRGRKRDAEAIRVEADLAEANAIRAELRSQQVATTGREVQAAREPAWYEMSWPFEKEYWRDELGHYSYHIASKCEQ